MNTLFEFCQKVNEFGFTAHFSAGFNRGDKVLPAFWDVWFENKAEGRFASKVYVTAFREVRLQTTSFGSLYGDELKEYVAEVNRGAQLVEFLNGLEMPGRASGLNALYHLHLLTYGAEVPVGNVFKCCYDDEN